MRMNTYFQRLKFERQRLELNQPDFAAKCGVTKLTQSNYETGKRKPDVEYLALAQAIGCDTQFVITGKRSFSADFDFHLQEKAIDLVAKYVHRSERKLAHPEMFYPVAMEIYQIFKKAQEENKEVDPVELGAKVISLFAA